MSTRRVVTAALVGACAAVIAPLTVRADSGYAVYAGYADTRQPAAAFPDPWPSARGKLPTGVVLFGSEAQAGVEDPDISGVRIDNTSGGAIIVNDVTVRCTGGSFDLGGPGAAAPLAGGGILIVVGKTPVDGSEVCTTPVNVLVKVDGTVTGYADAHVPNTTLGSAIVGANLNSESVPWSLLGGGVGPTCLTLANCLGSSAGAGIAIASTALVVFVGAAGFSAIGPGALPHPAAATAHAGATAHLAAGAHGATAGAPPPPPPAPPPTHFQEEAGDKLLEAGGSGLEVGLQSVEERAALEAGAEGLTGGGMRAARDDDEDGEPQE